jgi:hypothetical protein
MAEVDPRLLAGGWVHSHEEDTPGHAVYRPDGYAFPPSRGRGGFDLSADGTMVQLGPGPTDRTELRPGRWELEEGGALALYPEGSDTPQRVGTVADLSADKLVLRKDS